MKTALITGCSSGYGLAIARHFHAQGWRVVATMRTPRDDLFPDAPNLRVLPLDVTQPDSIAAAIQKTDDTHSAACSCPSPRSSFRISLGTSR